MQFTCLDMHQAHVREASDKFWACRGACVEHLDLEIVCPAPAVDRKLGQDYHAVLSRFSLLCWHRPVGTGDASCHKSCMLLRVPCSP